MKIYTSSRTDATIRRLDSLVGTDLWFRGYTTSGRIITWYHLISERGDEYQYSEYLYNSKYSFPIVVSQNQMDTLMGKSKYVRYLPKTEFNFTTPLEIYTTDELFRVAVDRDDLLRSAREQHENLQ